MGVRPERAELLMPKEQDSASRRSIYLTRRIIPISHRRYYVRARPLIQQQSLNSRSNNQIIKDCSLYVKQRVTGYWQNSDNSEGEKNGCSHFSLPHLVSLHVTVTLRLAIASCQKPVASRKYYQPRYLSSLHKVSGSRFSFSMSLK